MDTRRIRTRLGAALAAAALAVAACGGDDDAPPADDTATPTEATDAPDDPDPSADAPVETDAPDDGMLPLNPQDINPQPRDALAQGGEFRYPVASLPDNWNGAHPVGNEDDYSRIRGAMEFRLFVFNPEGEFFPDENFLLDYELDEGPPQTVTYRLNPDAIWNNGESIGVEDFVAFWRANNGENPEFTVVTTEGYDVIESVEQGADENEIVVTFAEPYVDWVGLFGQMPYRDGVADPETFNDGWAEITPDWFTGPFTFDNLDRAQQVIELVPNPNWWGEEPLLDRLIFRVVDLDAQATAFANNELDGFEIGPDPNAFQIASAVPGAEIRTALAPSWRQITFNHEAGLVAELEVRQAIAQGLDRAEIVASDLAGIPWQQEVLNNRILMANQEGYQDNAGEFDYDPDAARATLEAAGWAEGADGVYARDGQRLTVTFTQIAGVPVSENEARQLQDQLADVGIEVEIETIATADFGRVLEAGEFEMIAFSWIGSPFPFAGIDQVYGTGGDSNYANSDIPEVDALVGPIAGEFDLDERIRLANEVDRILWENMHTLPLYQRPDIHAVWEDFSGYGAYGLIRIDSAAQYENWGWVG